MDRWDGWEWMSLVDRRMDVMDGWKDDGMDGRMMG